MSFLISGIKLLGNLSNISEGQILAVVLAMFLMSAVAAVGKKIKFWFMPIHDVTITTDQAEPINVMNIRVTLKPEAVHDVAKVFVETSGVPVATPSEIDAAQAEKEKKFFEASGVKFKNKAQFMVNAFRAYSTGRMQAILPGLASIPKPVTEGFDQFIREMLGTEAQEGILHLGAQLSLFYNSCTALDNEVVVAWGDRHVLTTHRLVVMSAGKKPIIEHEVPLDRIKRYKDKIK